MTLHRILQECWTPSEIPFQSAKLGSFVYVKENSTREALEMKTAVDNVVKGANFSAHVHAESFVSTTE